MDLSVIDVQALERGNTIPTKDLERCFGLKASHRDFPLRCVQLAQHIETHFQMERGQVVAVVCRDDELHVLDHEEQARHSKKTRQASQRKLKRSHKLAQGVDPHQLPDDRARRIHEREVQFQAALLQAQQQVRQDVRPVFVRRTVPGL